MNPSRRYRFLASPTCEARDGSYRPRLARLKRALRSFAASSTDFSGSGGFVTSEGAGAVGEIAASPDSESGSLASTVEETVAVGAADEVEVFGLVLFF